MSPVRPDDHAATAVRVSVRGVVQGVGFRPFVYSLAGRYGLRGWVLNTSAGVEVLAEGPRDAVTGFAEALPAEAPPRSHIAACEVREVEPGVPADGPAAGDSFVILESSADPGAYQLVSPDIATCDDCRRELLDPGDRRHDYPFTNCTNCGPQVHDHRGPALRPRADDDAELPAVPGLPAGVRGPGRPALPRGAQRVPGVRAARAAAAVGGEGDGVIELAAGGEAGPAAPIRAAADLLRAGEILAVKGLGGFHLACDATDGEAVRRLKQRKRRPDKPLAVMFAGLEELRAHCRVGSEEAELLAARRSTRSCCWSGATSGRRARPGLRARRGRRRPGATRRSPSASATSARCSRTRRCTCCSCRPPAGRWS